MWGALLGSESVCQPACKCAWKSQPSLGSLPRVIPTLSQQDFWSMAAREKALLTFRTMKMPCVHPARFPSSSAHLLLLAFPGTNMIQLVVCSRECSCKLVRGRGGVGSPGDIPRGQFHLLRGLRSTATPEHSHTWVQPAQAMCSATCALTPKPFTSILATLSIPKTAGWSSRTRVNKHEQHDLTQLEVSLCSETSFSRWNK